MYRTYLPTTKTYLPTAEPTTDTYTPTANTLAPVSTEMEMAETAIPMERPTLGLIWRGDGHKAKQIIPSNAVSLDRRCIPQPLMVSPVPWLVRWPLLIAWV